MTEQAVEAGQVETEAKEVVAEASAQEAPAPLAAGGGTLDEANKTPATWPDDWRERIAGDNEGMLKQLRRYKSPEAYAKAGFEAQQRIRSGEVKAPLPENASEEQIIEWRRENGIPEKASGYLAELPEGLVVGDADKPVMTAFAEKMHALNAPPAVVKEAVSWYFAERENQLAAQAEADREFQRAAEDELRAEWGAEYRVTQTGIANYVKTLPDGLGDILLASRLPDNTKLGDNPAALRWLAGLVSELNPAATVLPGSIGDQRSLDTEIARLEKLMRTDRKAYNKEADRYSELLAARQKMRSRA